MVEKGRQEGEERGETVIDVNPKAILTERQRERERD